MRQKKRRYINSLIEKAEEECTANNARDFYKKVKFFKKGYIPNPYGVKNKEGIVVTETQQVIERWREYFCDLLNVDGVDFAPEEDNDDVYYHVQPKVEAPTREEVEAAVKALKSNKAPGRDGITAEILKKGGGVVIGKLWELIKIIWEREEIPEEWRESIVVPNSQERRERRM